MARIAKIASSLRWCRRNTSNGMGFLNARKTGRRGVVPRCPPLTRPDTLAMSLLRMDAGSDDGRPQTIVSGFFPRATSIAPGSRVGTGREGSTEPVDTQKDKLGRYRGKKVRRNGLDREW